METGRGPALPGSGQRPEARGKLTVRACRASLSCGDWILWASSQGAWVGLRGTKTPVLRAETRNSPTRLGRCPSSAAPEHRWDVTGSQPTHRPLEAASPLPPRPGPASAPLKLRTEQWAGLGHRRELLGPGLGDGERLVNTSELPAHLATLRTQPRAE